MPIQRRLPLLLPCAALLAACQQVPPPAPPPPPEPVPAPVAVAASAPAPAPVVTYPLLPPAQAQKAIANAVTLLENGHEDQARAELQRVLGGDPANAKAQHLMRQITGDPVALLGRESYSYTVRPNDSMSSIAGRLMGDVYSFYILARYNGIAVPRQVASGQTLRIPGKAPPPSAVREPAPKPEPTPKAETIAAAPVAAPEPPAPPAPSPGELAMRAGAAAEGRGDLEAALAEYRKAAGGSQPGAPAKVDQVRKQLVQRYSLAARTAFAKQDLDGAAAGWDRVLAVDPGNDTAVLEKQRALALKAKVDSLKK